MNTDTVRIEVGWPEVLALGLELAALVAVGAWGHQGAGWPGMIAAPLALAVVWSLFLSPRARWPVVGLAWPLAKLAVFTLAALATCATLGVLPPAVFLALAALSVALGGSR